MERRTSDAMRHIRRAAVTGLFAIWLAPLAAQAGGSATDAGSDTAMRGGRLVVEDQQEDAISTRLAPRRQGPAEEA